MEGSEFQYTEVELDGQRYTAVGFSEEPVPVISGLIRR